MKTIKFYLSTGTSSVTDYYVEIIESAVKRLGYNTQRSTTLDFIEKDDIVFTIDPRPFNDVYNLKKTKNIFNWFQGIIAEEIFYMEPKTIKTFLRKLKHEHLERKCLKKSKGNFFVSSAQVEHYKKKYGCTVKNYYVMPCFNQILAEECFSQEKYDHPTFVYSGGIGRWHCFPQTLSLYKKIKEKIPSASLTVFTTEKLEARQLIEKMGLKDVTISSFSDYQDAIRRMSPFKYGFLLRDNNEINNVATPTKMGTYLGCGIIPIFSPVISEYVKQFKHLKYFISESSISMMIDSILKMEEMEINADDVLNEYRLIFNTFFSKELHIQGIMKFLKGNELFQ